MASRLRIGVRILIVVLMVLLLGLLLGSGGLGVPHPAHHTN